MARAPKPEDGDAGILRQQLLDDYRYILDETVILSIINDEEDIVSSYDNIKSTLALLAKGTEQHTPPVTSSRSTPEENSKNLESLKLYFPDSSLDDIESVLKENGSDVERALQALNQLSLEAYQDARQKASAKSDDFHHGLPKFSEQSHDPSESAEVEMLRSAFPDIKEHTIKFVLKQCDGDSSRAFDELLNRQHLQETGQLTKGIDAFSTGLDGNDDATPNKARRAVDKKPPKKKARLDIAYKVTSPTTVDDAAESASGGPSGPTISSERYNSVAKRGTSGSSSSDGRVIPALPDFSSSREQLRAAASVSRLGPYGKQAAIVYLERGREEARQARADASDRADILVDQQSTPTEINLHGVTVDDGVRIAKQRVWQWWNSLGEECERNARNQSLTIITGLGNHSANGVSRLRKAVGEALRNDMWKVEVGTGRFHITGRAQALGTGTGSRRSRGSSTSS